MLYLRCSAPSAREFQALKLGFTKGGQNGGASRPEAGTAKSRARRKPGQVGFTRRMTRVFEARQRGAGTATAAPEIQEALDSLHIGLSNFHGYPRLGASSEKSRVGNECVSTGRSWLEP